jgi:hypothetical protein
LALAIQALLPLLLGAELAAVARSGDREVFELCAFGHLHLGGDGHGTSDRDAGTLCPICVALQASPAFTAPAPAALPLPSTAPSRVAPATVPAAPRFVALAAYRSRAPPAV